MNKISLSNERKPIKIQMGKFYREKSYGDIYILGYTGTGLCLISLKTGNRWCEPYPLEMIQKILVESNFEEITSPFTITPNS